MTHVHFRVLNRYSVLGAYVILSKRKEIMKIYHLHHYLSRTQFWLGKRKMNFGSQEIVGEEAGLLATYAFHQGCKINVEIMKARDRWYVLLSKLLFCYIPYVSESLIKTMDHQVYVFRTKQDNQCDVFQ